MKRILALFLILAGFAIWNSMGCSSTPTAAAPVTVTVNQQVLVTATNTPTGSPTMTPTKTATPVTIIASATFTPTGSPTPTPLIPTIFNFGSSGACNVNYWYVNYCPGGSLGVTAIGYNNSCSLDLTMSTSGNDGQIQVSSNAMGLPTDLTPYNITGLECYVNFNATCYTGGNTQYSVHACPYIVTGSPATLYGGNYNGWNQQNGQAAPNGAGNTWFLVSVSPSTNWTTNETNTTALGVDINMNNAVNCDIYIDDVRLF